MRSAARESPSPNGPRERPPGPGLRRSGPQSIISTTSVAVILARVAFARTRSTRPAAPGRSGARLHLHTRAAAARLRPEPVSRGSGLATFMRTLGGTARSNARPSGDNVATCEPVEDLDQTSWCDRRTGYERHHLFESVRRSGLSETTTARIRRLPKGTRTSDPTLHHRTAAWLGDRVVEPPVDIATPARVGRRKHVVPRSVAQVARRRRSSALSVCSQVKDFSERPKCP